MSAKSVHKLLCESVSIKNGKLYLERELDRKEYESIKNFLNKYQIAWNKQACAFIAKYPEDMEKIVEFIATGKLPKSKRDNHFFETPKKLVKKLISECDIGDSDYVFENLKVLEPSAGRGAILDELVKYFKPENITAVELDKDNYLYLKNKFPDVNLIHGDFLESDLPNDYDYVFMNPPFNKNEYAKHILKAKKLLNNTGELVAIAPTVFLLSPYDTYTSTLREEATYYNGCIDFYANAFEGTDIDVCIFKILNPDKFKYLQIKKEVIQRFVVEVYNEAGIHNIIENVTKKKGGKYISDLSYKEAMNTIEDIVDKVIEKNILQYRFEDNEGGYFLHLYPKGLKAEYVKALAEQFDIYTQEESLENAFRQSVIPKTKRKKRQQLKMAL